MYDFPENGTISNHVVLSLTVRNHPGVMSHIAGLFSRRAFNLDGILCMPVKDGSCSRMWLRVNTHEKLQQMLRQIEKLEDVLEVQCGGIDRDMLRQMESYFRMGSFSDENGSFSVRV
jgi:acetolactate synthase-1/3 small subunit